MENVEVQDMMVLQLNNYLLKVREVLLLLFGVMDSISVFGKSSEILDFLCVWDFVYEVNS